MLPVLYRIRRQAEFEGFFRSKKTASVQSPLITLYFAQTKEARPRFGFVVGLKVSKKAVVRNKVKRRMRAVVGRALPAVRTGVSAVLVARPPAEKSTFQEIEKTIIGLLRTARLMSVNQ